MSALGADSTISPASFTIAPDLYGRVMVTRDMELIRKIIAVIQNKKNVLPEVIQVPGVDSVVLARHLEMLVDAGLIAGTKQTYEMIVPFVRVKDLTWEGHDLAAALENDSVWQKLKSSFTASELMTLPLSVIKSVSVSLLTEWAKNKVGLS